MNTRQLRNLGVPDEAIGQAIQGVQQAVQGGLRGKDVKDARRA